MKERFDAGKYYIGDLCYVIDGKDWGDVVNQSFENDDAHGGVIEVYGEYAFMVGTQYGDGLYLAVDRRSWGNHDIPVDSGTVGVINTSALNRPALETAYCSGAVVVFHTDFDVSVAIDTNKDVKYLTIEKVDSSGENTGEILFQIEM